MSAPVWTWCVGVWGGGAHITTYTCSTYTHTVAGAEELGAAALEQLRLVCRRVRAQQTCVV